MKGGGREGEEESCHENSCLKSQHLITLINGFTCEKLVFFTSNLMNGKERIKWKYTLSTDLLLVCMIFGGTRCLPPVCDGSESIFGMGRDRACGLKQEAFPWLPKVKPDCLIPSFSLGHVAQGSRPSRVAQMRGTPGSQSLAALWQAASGRMQPSVGCSSLWLGSRRPALPSTSVSVSGFHPVLEVTWPTLWFLHIDHPTRAPVDSRTCFFPSVYKVLLF